ncbi:MAG: hypothetical protein GC160_25500 [Acidobacteria bacterium]|nr:hypothetical protein [Acidobacteriota bacterium]
MVLARERAAGADADGRRAGGLRHRGDPSRIGFRLSTWSPKRRDRRHDLGRGRQRDGELPGRRLPAAARAFSRPAADARARRGVGDRTGRNAAELRGALGRSRSHA